MEEGDKIIGNWVAAEDGKKHFLPAAKDFTACGIPFTTDGVDLPPATKDQPTCETCIAFSPARSSD